MVGIKFLAVGVEVSDKQEGKARMMQDKGFVGWQSQN